MCRCAEVAGAPGSRGLRREVGGDRVQIFVCGRPVDLQHKYHRADLDAVARGEDNLLDALAVVVGAVGAAKVFQAKRIAVADQPAVLSRDLTQGDAQVAVFAAADHGDVARDRETAPVPIRSEHHKYSLHSEVPRSIKWFGSDSATSTRSLPSRKWTE